MNQRTGFDSLVPCLCCNKMVLVRSQDWTNTSVGLCVGCYGFLPLQLIQVLYILRCQIGVQHIQISEMQADIKKLFTAQKDIEEFVLTTT